MSTTDFCKMPRARAVLDEAHIGDIRGALGTIRHSDTRAYVSTAITAEPFVFSRPLAWLTTPPCETVEPICGIEA
jgi:hypothetical protein